ncbi:MAG: competence/damage-inducible protein A [Bacteroidales bacterium]
MKAEIITIGDELLIGQVVDTNSAWMADQLNLLGINIHQITSISDSREHILSTLNEATLRADIILITGGLGPTNDDITKQTLSEYFDSPLVFNEGAYKQIEQLFGQRGFPVTPLNRLQAMLPGSCTPLPNECGTAAGMWFEKDNTIYISMPGVPFEMKSIMTQEVLPRLASLNNEVIVHKTILTQGVGESFLAATIADWENRLPAHIKLAYLPQPGLVRLRLSASGSDFDKLHSQISQITLELANLIPEYIFGYDNDTLEEVIGKQLLSLKLTLATAESCTGGYTAHLITSISGSSEYFKGSIVAYSNEIKENLLGVKHDTIVKSGAVSEETVKEMAVGARIKLDTYCAIAISGIAGPSGGTDEKPVGTTWIAISSPAGLVAEKFLLGEHRGRNIRKAGIAALNMLRKELDKIQQ